MSEHVAYLRYTERSIVTCDSDDEGAFKVYRQPLPERPREDPDDPYPDLVETICANVCGRDEGKNASFVAWLRKLLTAKLAGAHIEYLQKLTALSKLNHEPLNPKASAAASAVAAGLEPDCKAGDDEPPSHTHAELCDWTREAFERQAIINQLESDLADSRRDERRAHLKIASLYQENARRDRAIFDAGFKACRGMADNHIHYQGEQANKIFAAAMEKI